MTDRYNLTQCGCETESGDSCDAEMVLDPVGDYIEWADYEKLLRAWNELNEQLQDTLYSAPEFG